MSTEHHNGDKAEEALWTASRQRMAGNIGSDEYQQAQQQSRRDLRRGVAALARRRVREQATAPLKRLGRLLRRS